MGTRLTMQDLQNKKASGIPITMLTAYDYAFAVIVDRCGVDMILVGDSLANVVLGLDSTREVDMDIMVYHAAAVSRAVTTALVVGDMPYGSYHSDVADALSHARRFLAAGCQAVKIEWHDQCLPLVEAMVGSGIPVMGHVGLTPQTAEQLGGFKVQGKDAVSAQKIISQALELQSRGCFAMVLECVPNRVAGLITRSLNVPTIGIGAGNQCDGQVLVIHDLLGLTARKLPKFVKPFAALNETIEDAVRTFCSQVQQRSFPDDEHSYHISDDEFRNWEQKFLGGER